MAKPPLDQVGMLTVCTSISVSKRLLCTSVCRTSNLGFLLPQCLWPEPAAYRGLLAQPSLSAPHSKHTEVLGCGTVGAASSERAQPTWFSSCSPAVSVCLHFLHSLASAVRFLEPSHTGCSRDVTLFTNFRLLKLQNCSMISVFMVLSY